MNSIVGNAIVSCYMDAAAILVMVLLLLLSDRLRKRNTPSLRIFSTLCWQVLFTSVVCFIFNAMYRQPALWTRNVALISRTLWD